MAYKVTIGQFAKRCERLGGELEQAALRGLRSAGERMVGVVVEEINKPNPAEGVQHAAVDTGELQRSVKSTGTSDGALVSVDAPHAPYMEFGTRPHFPPPEPIAEWAYRKGLADDEEEAMRIALAICRTIARWGMNPRHYMARAVDTMKRRGVVGDEVKRELAKLKGI